MTDARFRIVFYRSASGRCQACDYAREMAPAHRIKAKRWFAALSREGAGLPVDFGKPLRDGVWELRVIVSHHQHRFLYTFWKDIIVVTNAFLKKSAAVPPEQIERARRHAADWVARRGWERA